MTDPHDLQRFLDAQAGGVHGQALAEVRRGRKTSHWMWFEFPQMAGLGRSHMAQKYAMSSAAEARAYVAHPVLGARLRQITRAVLDAPSASAEDLFGGIDAMKLRSSMTLFARAAPQEEAFGAVLGRFWGGAEDEATLDLLTAE